VISPGGPSKQVSTMRSMEKQVDMMISNGHTLQADRHDEVNKHTDDHADIEQADTPIWLKNLTKVLHTIYKTEAKEHDKIRRHAGEHDNIGQADPPSR